MIFCAAKKVLGPITHPKSAMLNFIPQFGERNIVVSRFEKFACRNSTNCSSSRSPSLPILRMQVGSYLSAWTSLNLSVGLVGDLPSWALGSMFSLNGLGCGIWRSTVIIVGSCFFRCHLDSFDCSVLWHLIEIS